MRPSLEVQAPAKLNLALRIGPPADDGYHPIASWMTTVGLCDEVEIVRLEPGVLSRYATIWHDDALWTTEIDWSVTDDLAVRAHLAFERTVGRSCPVQITVRKRIPLGAGLGGGSSDAAATLRGLDQLFEANLGSDVLRAVGLAIGSDVPFLVDGGSAFVGGFGEAVERVATPDLHMALVMPPLHCSTGEIYRAFDEAVAGDLDEASVRGAIATGLDAPINDLAEPAMRVVPELRGFVERVGALAERPPHVTGSGSAFYVLCDDAMHAEALANTITDRLDLVAVACHTVDPAAAV